MLPVAATSLHSFSSVPLVMGEGSKKQPVHWHMSEALREAISFGELAVTDFLAMDLELV